MEENDEVKSMEFRRQKEQEPLFFIKISPITIFLLTKKITPDVTAFSESSKYQFDCETLRDHQVSMQAIDN